MFNVTVISNPRMMRMMLHSGLPAAIHHMQILARFIKVPATQATAPLSSPTLPSDPLALPLKGTQSPSSSLQTLHLLFFQARGREARCLWAWSWTGWPTRVSSSRRGPPPPSRSPTPSITFACYHFQWCFWNLRKSHDCGGDSKKLGNHIIICVIPRLLIHRSAELAHLRHPLKWQSRHPVIKMGRL